MTRRPDSAPTAPSRRDPALVGICSHCGREMTRTAYSAIIRYDCRACRVTRQVRRT